MAVYAGQSKRKRAAWLLAAAALAVGLVIGVVIGRATAPSLDSRIADGRAGGRDLVSSLQVLPLEYSQAISGGEGTAQIGDTVDRVTSQLNKALDGAPWLGPAQRRDATRAIAGVRTAARDKVDKGRFEATVASATNLISTVFGLAITPGTG
jgi:hypothetical protein